MNEEELKQEENLREQSRFFIQLSEKNGELKAQVESCNNCKRLEVPNHNVKDKWELKI